MDKLYVYSGVKGVALIYTTSSLFSYSINGQVANCLKNDTIRYI